MTRCSCGHLSDAHNQSNGVCIWKNCFCTNFDPESEIPERSGVLCYMLNCYELALPNSIGCKRHTVSND